MHFKVLYFKNKKNINLRQRSIATVYFIRWRGEASLSPEMDRSKKSTQTLLRAEWSENHVRIAAACDTVLPQVQGHSSAGSRDHAEGSGGGPFLLPRRLTSFTVQPNTRQGVQAMRSEEFSSVQHGRTCAEVARPGARPYLMFSPADG